MVPDGNLEPVFVECVLWASDDRTDVESVCSGGVEIGVVADLYWELHLDVLDLVEQLAFQVGLVLDC